MLSAFASGKGTALVVDIGSEVMSVTPVCEGYVLRVGEHWSFFGGLVKGMRLGLGRLRGWLGGERWMAGSRVGCSRRKEGS